MEIAIIEYYNSAIVQHAIHRHYVQKDILEGMGSVNKGELYAHASGHHVGDRLGGTLLIEAKPWLQAKTLEGEQATAPPVSPLIRIDTVVSNATSDFSLS